MKYQVDSRTYENARQNFRKLFDRKCLFIWLPYRPERDRDVQVARVYLRDQSKYIAFLRIHPRGFVTPKKVSSDCKVIFHLLTGRSVFGYKNKVRYMTEGEYVSVPPGDTYTITNADPNITTYFLIQYVNLQISLEAPPQPLAIEAPPPRPSTDSTCDRVLRRTRRSTQFYEPEQVIKGRRRPSTRSSVGKRASHPRGSRR